MHRLLKQSLLNSATDAHDYVYWMRGLLFPEDVVHIPVDYTKPPFDAYQRALARVFDWGLDFQLLFDFRLTTQH
jgi:hypothetical protein